MRILEKPVTRNSILSESQVVFDDEMVKAVVDIKRNILAIDADLHADLEKMMLDAGSSQYDLWGINIYPDEEKPDMIEFDSLINIRPAQNNRSRTVENPKIQAEILKVVDQWIQ